MKQPAVCIIGACAVIAHFKLKWLSLHYQHGFECVYDEARSTVDIGRFVFSLLQPRGWYESPPTIALYTAATSLTSQPASRPAVQWWHDHGQSLSCLFEDPSFLHIYVDSINLMKHERRNENDVVNKKTVNRTKAYPNFFFIMKSKEPRSTFKSSWSKQNLLFQHIVKGLHIFSYHEGQQQQ